MNCLVLFVLLLAGCASSSSSSSKPSDEQSPATAPAWQPGWACYLLPEHAHAPAGACFVITADEWSTVVTCEGTQDHDETIKVWMTVGNAQEVSSFEVPGGGCYQWYDCTPDGVAAPTVQACP